MVSRLGHATFDRAAAFSAYPGMGGLHYLDRAQTASYYEISTGKSSPRKASGLPHGARGWSLSPRAGAGLALMAETRMMLDIQSYKTWQFGQSRKFSNPRWLPWNPDNVPCRCRLPPRARQREIISFTWFPPQLARFKPDRLPAVSYGFEQKPVDFDWRWHHGELYRYFVIRHTEPIPADIFKGANCSPAKILQSGAWTLFERRGCAPSSHGAGGNTAPGYPQPMAIRQQEPS